MSKPNSSNVANVAYDSNTLVLTVEYVGGNVYQYANVPVYVYNGLMSTEKKGSFIHANIKGRYAYKKVS